MTVKNERNTAVETLIKTVEKLLAPNGCPWDREQSFASMKRYLVEEASEVCDAIDGLGDEATLPQGPATRLNRESPEVLEFREELGDLLLQVVFHCEMARTRGWFTLAEVSEGIACKLIRRHPHVFGETTVSNSSEVLANWEEIKLREKQGRGLLAGLPRSLPALRWAQRAGEKCAHVGFDWDDADGPRAKVDEELRELDEARARGTHDEIEHELGDVLFSLCNLARKLDVDPEDALRKANARFAKRFIAVERRVNESGRSFKAHTPEELDAYWNEAKREER
jgi:tetrapyrrole methylase family protein/MazG family protein/ATP diphosphatase